MADALKKSLGITAELIPGSGGVFDVKADGQMVFSKKIAGRFPDSAEVLTALKG